MKASKQSVITIELTEREAECLHRFISHNVDFDLYDESQKRAANDMKVSNDISDVIYDALNF